MHETRALAEFAATTKLAELPTDVVHETKRVLLDQLGCQIACARLPWSQIVYQAVRGLAGAGPATVVVLGDRLAADEAAFVNSVFAHGNEIDDAHISYRTHPGSTVIPAALATSQLDEAVTGAQLLAAVALGTEVMLRVADAATSALKDVRFHNTSSTVGPFGSAAASARLLGADDVVMEHALAIAGYQASGVRQHSVSGGSVKRLQTGLGAKAGLRSAWLARAGVTGPAEILEGARGFLRSYSGEERPERLVDGLGTTFLSRGPCFKRFSVKYRIHSTVDAVVELVTRQGLSIDEIASMRVGVSESTLANHGIIFEPASFEGVSNQTQQAQLSIRFSMAVVAKHGPGILGHLSEADFNEPEVLDLARRIEVYREPAQEREEWMNWGCVVSLETTDGRHLETAVPAPVGSPRNPMTDEEVAEKFHRIAGPVIGEQRAAAIEAIVWSMEEHSPSVDLLPLTIGAVPS